MEHLVNVVMRSLSGSKPDPIRYGHKAIGLWWLRRNGFDVPPAILLSKAFSASDKRWHELYELTAEVLGPVSISEPYIVRSSSPSEDRRAASHAGEYLSIMNVTSHSELRRAVKAVSSAHRAADDTLPVIVQRQISPKYSGVLFPTSPLTGDKNESQIEAVRGLSDEVLSGRVRAGALFAVSAAGRVEKAYGDLRMPKPVLLRLRRIGVLIEKLKRFPCDIEWAIDVEDRLWLLQVRPVVNGLYRSLAIEPVEICEKRSASGQDDKVKLRVVAAKTRVPISRAWIMKVNATSSDKVVRSATRFLSPRGLYSFVVLSPTHVRGKIVRRFGFGEGASGAIQRILKTVSEEYWRCDIIIKEVLDAVYTGTAMKDPEGYWIEIARGHYVPKGFVEVSRYRFDNRKRIQQRTLSFQSSAFDVHPSGAVRRTLSSPPTYPSVETLKKAIGQFDKVWRHLTGILEFGIDAKGTAFLLDFMPTSGADDISPALALHGVISRGVTSGRLVRIDDTLHTSMSENWHAKNSVNKSSSEFDGCVIVARRPFISLMQYLAPDTGRGARGFVFDEPSLLSHLSLQLRERNIPAISCSPEHSNNLIGRIVLLDACAEGLDPVDRLTVKTRGIRGGDHE